MSSNKIQPDSSYARFSHPLKIGDDNIAEVKSMAAMALEFEI